MAGAKTAADVVYQTAVQPKVEAAKSIADIAGNVGSSLLKSGAEAVGIPTTPEQWKGEADAAKQTLQRYLPGPVTAGFVAAGQAPQPQTGGFFEALGQGAMGGAPGAKEGVTAMLKEAGKEWANSYERSLLSEKPGLMDKALAAASATGQTLMSPYQPVGAALQDAKKYVQIGGDIAGRLWAGEALEGKENADSLKEYETLFKKGFSARFPEYKGKDTESAWNNFWNVAKEQAVNDPYNTALMLVAPFEIGAKIVEARVAAGRPLTPEEFHSFSDAQRQALGIQPTEPAVEKAFRDFQAQQASAREVVGPEAFEKAKAGLPTVSAQELPEPKPEEKQSLKQQADQAIVKEQDEHSALLKDRERALQEGAPPSAAGQPPSLIAGKAARTAEIARQAAKLKSDEEIPDATALYDELERRSADPNRPTIPVSGAEHQGYYDPVTNRVYKITKPGMYGYDWRDAMGTPASYLNRIRMIRDVFGVDRRVEGKVTDANGNVGILTSEPWYEGGKPNEAALKADIKNRGYLLADDRDVGGMAYNPKNNTYIWDWREDNSYATKEGLKHYDVNGGEASPAIRQEFIDRWKTAHPNEELPESLREAAAPPTEPPKPPKAAPPGAAEPTPTPEPAKGPPPVPQAKGPPPLPKAEDANAFVKPAEDLAQKLGAKPAEEKAAAPTEPVAQKIKEAGFEKHEFNMNAPPVASLREIRGWIQTISALKRMTGGEKVLAKWDAALQRGSMAARSLWKQLRERVPNEGDQEGIVNYLDLGGDENKIREALRRAREDIKDEKLAKGYEKALNLSPEDKALAQELVQFYKQMKDTANERGVFEGGLDNYINRIVKSVSGKQAEVRGGGKVVNKPHFAHARLFETMIDGEAAGYRYHKTLPDLVAAYSEEMSKAIATKDFIKDLLSMKAADGRPLAIIKGYAGQDGDSPLFVKPGVNPKEFNDYKPLDNGVLSSWKWAGQVKPPVLPAAMQALIDADPKLKDMQKIMGGEPKNVMLKGELSFHPEIHQYVNNALNTSGIRRWYNSPSEGVMRYVKAAAKTVDTLQAVGKQFMFGLSGFHYVQEGTHALGHRVNPFFNPFRGVDKINWDSPVEKALVEHGLKVAGDFNGMAHFREGLGGGQALYKISDFLSQKLGLSWLTKKLPGNLATDNVVRSLSEFLFNDYIPWLKMKTAKAMLERNLDRFQGDLASGRVSMDELYRLSAEQSNAAYGHLNYTMLGRDPTVQHMLRMVILAPDFLEARSRFAGQAIKGILSKGGREQFAAMATLAIAQAAVAKTVNAVFDKDHNPHWEKPFSVVLGGREFRMRSVPEDMFRLWSDSRAFIMGRESPILKFVQEWATKRDYQNKPIGFSDSFLHLMGTYIPISFRQRSDVSVWQNMMTSMGFQFSRYSPSTTVYDWAEKWRSSHGLGQETGDFAPSKYRDLRNALEDEDYDLARKRFDALVADANGNRQRIVKGLQISLHKPFTGSAREDQKMKAALDPIDRMVYERAEQGRRETWRRFNQMLGTTSPTGPGPVEQIMQSIKDYQEPAEVAH